MTTSLDEYLRAIPSDEETARRAVDRYLSLTPAERFESLTDLLREMDAVLGGRAPWRDETETPFWRHWMDPNVGRPDTAS